MRNRRFDAFMELLGRAHARRGAPVPPGSFISCIMAEIHAGQLTFEAPGERLIPRFALAAALTAAFCLAVSIHGLIGMGTTAYSMYMTQATSGLALNMVGL